jgi:histidinol-phosphate phosphatase family protein
MTDLPITALVVHPAVRGRGPGSARPGRPFVFLDKDGTLIEDLPYNVDPRRVRFAPGARHAVHLLAHGGFGLAVCSNQSGVARGYYDLADLRRLGRHLVIELDELGARLEGFFACPHLPTGSNAEFAIACDCRKPAPGLILQAAALLGADLGRSWMIGDTWMDVAAGRNAGCRTILVGPEWRLAGTLPPDRQPDHAVPDLVEAARIIVLPQLNADDEVGHGELAGAAPRSWAGIDARPAPSAGRVARQAASR